MKTLAKTTIRNAGRRQLLDFISYLDSDYPDHLTLPELRRKARECENKSRRWFGGKISFSEWVNS